MNGRKQQLRDILSESKQSEEMWHNIMIAALSVVKDILQDSKSFRNLINRSIAMSPTASCSAILNVFEKSQAPLHVSVLIEKWATKFASISEAPDWRRVLFLLLKVSYSEKKTL